MNYLEDQWLVLCKAIQLRRRPKRFVVMDTPIVVYRHNDTIIALHDICPHRHASLSGGKIIDGEIQCPYHGWRFNSSGGNTFRPGGDSTRPKNCLKTFQTCIFQGMVWIRLEGTQVLRESPFKLLGNKRYTSYVWRFNAEGDYLDLIENFLDATHTHFIHKGLIRNDSKAREVVDVTIEAQKDKVCLNYGSEQLKTGLIPKLFEKFRTYSKGIFEFPNTAIIEYGDRKGVSLQIIASITPISKNDHSVTVWFVFRRGIIPSLIKYLCALPLFLIALKQDMKIVKNQLDNKQFSKASYMISTLDFVRPYLMKIINQDEIKVSKRVKRVYL